MGSGTEVALAIFAVAGSVLALALAMVYVAVRFK